MRPRDYNFNDYDKAQNLLSFFTKPNEVDKKETNPACEAKSKTKPVADKKELPTQHWPTLGY